MRGAALAGVGLTAIPSWMISEELSRGDLVEVMADWPTVEYGIYAAYPSNRLVAKKVKLFAELVACRIASSVWTSRAAPPNSAGALSAQGFDGIRPFFCQIRATETASGRIF